MGKSSPSPPPAPNPVTTASAQGAANIQTAIANTALNNANVYTPYGQTTFQQTGTQQVTMPDGSVQNLPTYSEHQDLSNEQQTLLYQNESLGMQTNGIAARALNTIGNTLAHPIQQSQLSPLQLSAGQTPTLATGYGTTGNATGYDNGGTIQSSVGVQQAPTGFGH